MQDIFLSVILDRTVEGRYVNSIFVVLSCVSLASSCCTVCVLLNLSKSRVLKCFTSVLLHGGAKGQCRYRPELVRCVQLPFGKRVTPVCVSPGQVSSADVVQRVVLQFTPLPLFFYDSRYTLKA